MPRGNDAKAAAAELADRFAIGQGNAEALIQANNAERSPELLAASAKKVDPDATAAALDQLDKYKGPDGEKALDVAIRGEDEQVAVVAYEDDDGRVRKAVVEVKKAGAGEPSKKSSRKAASKARSEQAADDK